MTSKYGPCAGITRLDRWDRAKKLGLNPPEEVRLFPHPLSMRVWDVIPRNPTRPMRVVRD